MRGVVDMGMFGSSRPRTMNDIAMQGRVPVDLAQPQLQPMAMPQMAPQASPQMNDGRPHGARRIAGLLSSFASGALGMPDRYGQSVAHNQEQQRQLQLAQQQQTQDRAYEESQWRARQEWQQAHPDPQPPTEMERVLQAAGYAPGSPEYTTQMQAYARNRADPMQTINNGDGTFTLVRPSQLQSQGRPAPQAAPNRPAIGATVADPRRAGGQASPAPANFPPHG